MVLVSAVPKAQRATIPKVCNSNGPVPNPTNPNSEPKPKP